MNYTLETSARLQQVYEDKNAPESVRLQAWHELHKRWREQPLPQSGFAAPDLRNYYSRPIHFMPRP